MPNDPYAPLACALSSDELTKRLDWIRRVSAHGLVAHRRESASLRLSYKLSALPDLQRLVAQEAVCSPHLSFLLKRGAGMVSLVINAPTDRRNETHWLFDQLAPSQVPSQGKACGCAAGACG